LGTATNSMHWETRATALKSGEESEQVDCWDVATFEESVARCEEKAYRLAVHLVRSESAAQEILQETFLSAWQNASSFANRTQFSAWVYRATVQCALGRLKSASAQRPSPDGHVISLSSIPTFWGRARRMGESDWSILPAHELSSEALFHHIRETFNLLPPELRAVFVLCDVEELSVADSAEILDLSVAETEENLHAARMVICHAIGLHFARGGRKCLGHTS
jgi:RNA polymerase sigma-70 factor, ECF subfamily